MKETMCKIGCKPGQFEKVKTVRSPNSTTE